MGDEQLLKEGNFESERKQCHVCNIMVLLWMEFYGWGILFILPTFGLIL